MIFSSPLTSRVSILSPSISRSYSMVNCRFHWYRRLLHRFFCHGRGETFTNGIPDTLKGVVFQWICNWEISCFNNCCHWFSELPFWYYGNTRVWHLLCGFLYLHRPIPLVKKRRHQCKSAVFYRQYQVHFANSLNEVFLAASSIIKFGCIVLVSIHPTQKSRQDRGPWFPALWVWYLPFGAKPFFKHEIVPVEVVNAFVCIKKLSRLDLGIKSGFNTITGIAGQSNEGGFVVFL